MNPLISPNRIFDLDDFNLLAINEQLAMKQVLSNPLEGAEQLTKVTMTDKRWLEKDGWVKMSNNVNGTEIHFVYNTKTGEFDDFKFK